MKQLVLGASWPAAGADAPSTTPSRNVGLSKDDHALLEEIEKACFLFFWEQTNAQTGLIKDRCAPAQNPDKHTVGSIAATGFGLSALCIGHKRGYASSGALQSRVINTLE